jgi:hypothetical protein
MSLIYLVGADEQDQYFQDEIIKNNLITTGDIVFKHLDTSKIDYSKFIPNHNIN